MKKHEQNGKNSQPETNCSPGNGSGTAVGHGSPSVDTPQTGSSRPVGKKTRSSVLTRHATGPRTPASTGVREEESSAHSLVVQRPATSSPSPVRRATGPRTPQGKQRSSRNSLKHGIFSRTVLLKGESVGEFRLFRAGLFKDFQPYGAMQELLVDELVELAWRRRRLLVAESAALDALSTEGLNVEGKARTFEESLRAIRGARPARDAVRATDAFPSVYSNSRAISQDIDGLEKLCAKIAECGLDLNKDSRLLSQIFGSDVLEHPPNILFEMFGSLAKANKDCDPSVRISVGAGEIKDIAIKLLNVEIQKLRTLHRAITEQQGPRVDRRSDAVLRLPSEMLDQLLRYQSTLERSFDRTLSQIERVQRMRAGQPVPPELKVRLSG
jgi:hypothetical protein